MGGTSRKPIYMETTAITYVSKIGEIIHNTLSGYNDHTYIFIGYEYLRCK